MSRSLRLRHMPVIAMTPTTRVRTFTIGGRERVAVWRAFRLILTLAIALLASGCAGRTSAAVAVGAGVDRETVVAAVKIWNDASAEFALGVVDASEPHDVIVEWRDLSGLSPRCADAEFIANAIRLNTGAGMGPGCAGALDRVIAHELGHWMAVRNDHLTDGNLMATSIGHTPDAPTAADVDYVNGGGS